MCHIFFKMYSVRLSCPSQFSPVDLLVSHVMKISCLMTQRLCRIAFFPVKTVSTIFFLKIIFICSSTHFEILQMETFLTIRFYDNVDKARLLFYSVDELTKALLCPLQRVQELERENSLLKDEKEAMNQKILRQSQSSGGEFHTSLHLHLWTHTSSVEYRMKLK